MNNIIDDSKEKTCSKNSSRPKGKMSQKVLVAQQITPQLTYKKGGDVLSVCEISEKNIYDITEGDFYPTNNVRFKYAFRGEAQIGIKDSNGIATSLRTIRGYFNIVDEEELEIYTIIQISERY